MSSASCALNDKFGDFYIFLLPVPIKRLNQQQIESANICEFITWIILFICAIHLHCCLTTIKKAQHGIKLKSAVALQVQFYKSMTCDNVLMCVRLTRLCKSLQELYSKSQEVVICSTSEAMETEAHVLARAVVLHSVKPVKVMAIISLWSCL